MKKKVNIFPRSAITAVNPPIRSNMGGVVRDVKDIRMCIIAGAKVEELLPDGRKVVLNLQNYDLDNADSPYAIGRAVRTASPKSVVNGTVLMSSPAESIPEVPNPFKAMTVVSPQEVKSEVVPAKDEDIKVEEPEVASFNPETATQSGLEGAVNEDQIGENASETANLGNNTEVVENISSEPKLSRKERRALERAKRQEEAQNGNTGAEIVITDDPE